MFERACIALHGIGTLPILAYDPHPVPAVWLRFAFSPCRRLFSNGRSMFPFAVLYFTGSGHFNMSMRAFAKAKGLKLSDKGLFKVNMVNGKEVYKFDDSFKYVPVHICYDSSSSSSSSSSARCSQT